MPEPPPPDGRVVRWSAWLQLRPWRRTHALVLPKRARFGSEHCGHASNPLSSVHVATVEEASGDVRVKVLLTTPSTQRCALSASSRRGVCCCPARECGRVRRKRDDSDASTHARPVKVARTTPAAGEFDGISSLDAGPIQPPRQPEHRPAMGNG